MGKQQLGFYVNQNQCIGCKACAVACKVKNSLTPGLQWRTVDSFETEKNGRVVERWLSHSCHHCEYPACESVCPVKAYTKREEDGIVVQHHQLCIGCRQCIAACPYNAPHYDRKTNKVSKCDLCADLLDQGENPACVRGCPVQCLEHGELTELEDRGGVREAVGFKNSGTNPSIRFAEPVISAR